MAISIEEVKKVAKLARLKLLPEEEQRYTTELSAILGYIDQLKGLSIADQSPRLDNVHGLADLRLDSADGGRRQNEILSLAPTRKDNYLTVPTVF